MDYAQRTGLTFPILKPSELVRCMADVGIPFSEEDVSKPTTQRLLAVYEHFTKLILGVTRASFAVPSFNVQQALEYPELHQDALNFMGFYQQLRRLMKEVCVQDFSMRDLLRPEPPRVRRCLSGLVNFAKFREQRIDTFQRSKEKHRDTILEIARMDQENRELSERVNVLRLERAEQEPAVRELRERNSKWEADLRELQRQQAALTANVDRQKKEKAELSDALTKTQMTIMNLKQDCARIKSRIVQSPEKLKASIAEMSDSLTSDKAAVMATEKRARELQAKIDMMSSIEQDIRGCLNLMTECEAEKKKAEAASAKVILDKENLDKRRADSNELEFREEQLKRQLTGANDKIARLEKHQTVKENAMFAKLTRLKEEFRLASIEKAQCQERTDQNSKVIIEMESKAAELRMQESVDAAGLEDMILKLETHVLAYQATLEKAIHVDL
ncbi:kinetochore-associated Ndc80 complex subunit nuf2 [Geranomyces variabilis]|nr:Nuf2 family-domain-containing protein [Geranomyces variabilis]KAJ3133604.1 kinetochore-associated Ndc80 complex subunit nuf2 [Geranomyces variabilis]KAJ3155849.1 kinetochore-associated Ndc80 complex subunit nuf2 [Geranomyces variabilis]KAJ3165928.1 kinetochore-associated Ndc80 complex subunit nuf2 [Geranomyces variabilis]